MALKSKALYLAILTAMSLWASANALAADDEVPLGNEDKPKAQAAKTDGATKDNSEVDISDIQNQYWKAHDKEFEVIQNKLFTKTGRIEVAPLFGFYQRVDFQDTKTLGASVAYHFSEMWGMEVMAYKMFNNDSSTLKRFQDTRGATIEFNKESYYIGASALFTPIYGKFSLFGKKISHFDLYIAPNLGTTKTSANRITYGAAIGQKFWITPKWNVRIEYRYMRYTDRTTTSQGATATQNGGPGYFEDTVNNQNLIFGISYLFN